VIGRGRGGEVERVITGLTPAFLLVQIMLVSRLAREAAQRDAMSGDERSMMCLPDEDGVMFPVDELVYDDAAWLSSTLQGVRFLNKNIPNEVTPCAPAPNPPP
jgi:hypothetical protein